MKRVCVVQHVKEQKEEHCVGGEHVPVFQILTVRGGRVNPLAFHKLPNYLSSEIKRCSMSYRSVITGLQPPSGPW